ncbi:MAG: glycosyltransferase family 4 protein [Calothrix sp. MO_167.B42]|nr:glycosyltransferase family 4 protein [Calothrix sp. MO_167.B42]
MATQIKSWKLLFVSTPVGPLGTGLGGGVELTLHNIAQQMLHRHHQLQVVAPANSTWEHIPIVQIPGNLQIIAQSQKRTDAITMPENSLLANMWDYVREVESEYDLIVNFAYDWLPFYLTPFYQRPIAHLVSMGSLSNAMDEIIAQVGKRFPHTLGFHSSHQADTFPGLTQPLHILSNGIDVSLYDFCPQAKQQLAWIGRISPEKGLEDAVALSQKMNIPLKIMGKLQDESYWQKICQDYPQAPMEYLGFLSTTQMQKIVRECRALLMTHRWVEAFGNVAIEALACGVPVISYNRGGPAEIVRHGETGFLVTPDSIPGLVEAVSRLDDISRHGCRQQAETEFSLEALGDRLERWFGKILELRVKS